MTGWFVNETQAEIEMRQLRTRNANRARRLNPNEVATLIASLNESSPHILRDLLDDLDDAEALE
jgi:hypothetical protein